MAKTQTQTRKALSSAELRKRMAQPIGGAEATAKPESKAQGEKPSGLFRMEVSPVAGKVLRAYFVALISAQTGGKLQAEKPFKLWPAINIRTHLANARIKRAGAGLYSLTVPGLNYFTDPAQAADPDMLSKFATAIKTGTASEIFKGRMLPL